ncbi:hypothetical protein BT96DRAFT_917661 [Gymnopus androsaceus JB14]|uniref:Uncharacterized protein n=1 Tax=Gymnopus androsaceus JB14 TaxID=1447944 RepID=A0A6A4HZT1_9AGAR|nr:hypothetical protein BT96DRAFT_917661 [Gymnopus androsaceus JB14]
MSLRKNLLNHSFLCSRDKLTTFVEAEGVLSNVSNLPPLTCKRMRRDGVDGSLPSSSEHSEPNVNFAEIARPLAGSQRADSSIPNVDNFGHFPSNSFVNVPSSSFESSASVWTDGGLFRYCRCKLLAPAAFDEAFGKGSQTASAYQISENDVLPSDTIQNELTDWDTFMKDIDDALVSMWA